MVKFFENIKKIFDKIPVKSKFLKDLHLMKNQTGFRYFMQGHHSEPNRKFMEILCEELDYDYVLVPINHSDKHREIRDKLLLDFETDLDTYVEKYKQDEPRTGSQVTKETSALAEANIAFDADVDFDPNKQIDISGLFE